MNWIGKISRQKVIELEMREINTLINREKETVGREDTDTDMITDRQREKDIERG